MAIIFVLFVCLYGQQSPISRIPSSPVSLVFGGATSDRVNHGNTGNNPEIATFYAWIYNTTNTGGRRIFSKTQVGAGGAGQFSLFVPVSGPNRLRAFMDYSGTDASAVSADDTTATNAWYFVAMTFDATNAPHIYVARWNSSLSEASYSSTAAPTGSRIDDSSAPVFIGNDDSFADAFPGSIALAHFIPNTVLSLTQLRSHMKWPHCEPKTAFLTVYGLNGTGLQMDLCGKRNNGTVTGAVLGQGLPYVLRNWARGGL